MNLTYKSCDVSQYKPYMLGDVPDGLWEAEGWPDTLAIRDGIGWWFLHPDKVDWDVVYIKGWKVSDYADEKHTLRRIE